MSRRLPTRSSARSSPRSVSMTCLRFANSPAADRRRLVCFEENIIIRDRIRALQPGQKYLLSPAVILSVRLTAFSLLRLLRDQAGSILLAPAAARSGRQHSLRSAQQGQIHKICHDLTDRDNDGEDAVQEERKRNKCSDNRQDDRNNKHAQD